MTAPRDHPIRVFFVGLEPSTIFPLLASQRINLVGASRISGIEYSTFNPFDRILQAFHLGTLRSRLVARCLPWLSFAMSARARRYAKYVSACALSGLKTFDVEKDSAALRKQNFDILLCNVWDLIPQWLIERCNIGAINIHPSLLPQYRGAVPTLCTLANRDKVSAVSYLKIEPGYDTGALICQIPFEITDDDDFQSLEDKIQSIVDETVCSIVIGYSKGVMTPILQDESHKSYTPRYEGYRVIDFEIEGCREVYNKIGLYPRLDPGTHCYLDILGRKIFIKKSNYAHGTYGERRIKISPIKIVIFLKDGLVFSYLFKDLSIGDSIFLLKRRHEVEGI